MRECGVLMPVSSLPGPYGIGSFGKQAYAFVDFLAQAGQQIWQILPLSPTGYGDSPYQSCSAFAINPYFIDLDTLREEGLLEKEEYGTIDWGESPEAVDYGALYEGRFTVLRQAYARFQAWLPDDYYTFCFWNEDWLEDYALYMTAKGLNKMKAYPEWPAPLRTRQPQALEQLRAENAEELGFWRFLQYQGYRQWMALKAYANKKGVQILGDIPIYVAADSADAWAGGKLFQVDEEGKLTRVAGCPPDYFSEDGQLWGNPLYDWPQHKASGYAWWIRRVEHALTMYDRLRIDHFRAFDTYYAIPAGRENARVGDWEYGPGMDLFRALEAKLGKLPIVAEDLGDLFDSVRVLLKESGYPGMKVMQFAFGGTPENEYLPHNHIPNCVVYPGTHDNTTLRDWLKNGDPKELARAKNYLGLNAMEGSVRGFLRGVLSSCANLAVIPMADWLELGAEGRINTPGTGMGNWTWRAKEDAFAPALAQRIRRTCARYGRCAPLPEPEEARPVVPVKKSAQKEEPAETAAKTPAAQTAEAAQKAAAKAEKE